MTTLYKDHRNKQLVYIDQIDNTYFFEEMQKIDVLIEKSKINKTMSRKIDDMVAYYVFGEMNHPTVSYRLEPNTPYIPFFKKFIDKSLELFSKAGLRVDYENYGGTFTIEEYNVNNDHTTSLCDSEKIETNGWAHKYSVNNSNEESSDDFYYEKYGHSCIFCIEKDEEITGGNIHFYPHFEDEETITNELYYLLTGNWSSHHQELEIPMKKGTVIVLSGDTYHFLTGMKMFKRNKLKLITVTMYYKK